MEQSGLILEGPTLTTGSLLGDPVFIGAVKNGSNDSLSGISVTFRYLDESRKRVIETRTASILSAGAVGPGEKAPFVIGLPNSGDGPWDTVEVTLAVDPYAGFFSGKAVEGLEIRDLETQKGEITGTIYNGTNEVLGGDQLLEGFDVGVIGYDLAGQIVLVGSDTVGEKLAPGYSTSFRVDYFWGLSEQAVRYDVRVVVRPEF